MNQELYDIISDEVENLKRLELVLAAVFERNGKADEALDKLFAVRRKMELACNEFLKRGERLPLTSTFELTCPGCQKVMPSTDFMYLHLRKDHGYPDEEAAVKAHEGKGQYEDEIAALRDLLPRHTGVLIEEDDPFQTKEN
jgi:hypothetical protein